MDNSVYDITISLPNESLHLEYKRMVEGVTRRVDVYGPGHVEEAVIELMTQLMGSPISVGEQEEELAVFGLKDAAELAAEQEHFKIVLAGIRQTQNHPTEEIIVDGHFIFVKPRSIRLLEENHVARGQFTKMEGSIRAHLLGEEPMKNEGQISKGIENS